MVEGLLEGQMDPHFSPIHTLRNLGATIQVLATQDGVTFRVDDLQVTGRINPHGSYSALAYRLEQDGQQVVYAPDAGYNGEPSPQTQELYHGASVLIHDCTYTGPDQRARRSRGQSSIEEAAHVAAMCQVKSLVMFHYDQDYTDQQVDGLRDRCREYLDREPGGKAIELVAAAEGLTLHTD